MKRRWYDHDPVLSMAISLLTNTGPDSQRQAAQRCFDFLKEKGWLGSDDVEAPEKSPNFLNRIYKPFLQRGNDPLDPEVNRLMGVLRNMDPDSQNETAFFLIDAMVELDHLDDPALRAQMPWRADAILDALQLSDSPLDQESVRHLC